MHSVRFGCPVVLTEHARRRMQERAIDEAIVHEVIETGTAKAAGAMHLWIYKHFEERDDNLLCVAAVLDNALVIKTVMNHWEWQ